MLTGEKIRLLRLQNKMSQFQLAKALNTATQTIGKYETGVVTNIPIERIYALSSIFQVEPSYFLSNSEMSPNKARLLYLVGQMSEQQISSFLAYIESNLQQGE